MLSKLIIFLISFLSVISCAISIGQLNITCLNICIAACFLLLLSMKPNTKVTFLLVLYLGCSVEILLFSIINIINTNIGIKALGINIFGITVLTSLGYFIIKQAFICKTLLFTTTLILNCSICYHGFSFDYFALEFCVLVLLIIGNGRVKQGFSSKEKMILLLGIIGLCIYNIIFIIPGIIFILNEKYSYIINKSESVYNIRYAIYICVLAYLLFIRNNYLPQDLWSNLWSSFENIFNFYPIYTAIILAYAFLNFKNKIMLNSRELLSSILLVNIFLLLFNNNLWENDVLVTGEIVAGIFICIPKVSLKMHEWTDYMLTSYGIALTGIYMLSLNIV